MRIETYIKRIKINRQFSKSTIESYTRILKKFDDYIKTNSPEKRSLENTQQLQLIDIE
jgi:site-specific recombinase XerD